MIRPINYYKIGMFVFAGFVFLTIFIIVLGGRGLFPSGIMAETYLDESVQGLSEGSPVKMRGVNIGNVEEIMFAHNKYKTDLRYVLIEMRLYPQVFKETSMNEIESASLKEISRGLRIRLREQGITGKSYLELDYFAPDRYDSLPFGWDPEYLYIPSVPSTILQVTEAINQIYLKFEKMDIEQAFTNLSQILEEISGNLETLNFSAIQNEFRDTLLAVKNASENVGGLFNQKEWQPVLKNAKGSLEQMEQFLSFTETELQKGFTQWAGISKNIEALLSDWKAASKDLPVPVERLNRILSQLNFFLNREMGEIESIIDNLKIVIQNAREISSTAKQYPSQVLFGEPPEQK